MVEGVYKKNSGQKCMQNYPTCKITYEGRSICNENSPVNPSFKCKHFIITLITSKRSVSWLINVKLQLSSFLSNLHKPLSR